MKQFKLFFDRKKIFFENENYFSENENFGKDFEIFEIFINKNFSINTFSKNIFFRSKKKLRKFPNHYIDVKFSKESIFRIHFVV